MVSRDPSDLKREKAYLPTHLTDQEVRRRKGYLKRGGESDGTKRTVRCHSDVIRFGHVGDPSRLRDAARVRNVGLDDVDATGLKVGPYILPSKESLAELDRLIGEFEPESRIPLRLTAIGMLVFR